MRRNCDARFSPESTSSGAAAQRRQADVLADLTQFEPAGCQALSTDVSDPDRNDGPSAPKYCRRFVSRWSSILEVLRSRVMTVRAKLRSWSVRRRARHAVSAHRRHWLYRAASAARIAEARPPPAGPAAAAEFSPDIGRERGDWRSRPAAKHVSGAAGSGCSHPLGRDCADNVRRSGRRLPCGQRRGDHRPCSRRAPGRRQTLCLPVLDPRPIRPDGRYGPDRGNRTKTDGCLWKVQARGRARPGGTRHRLGVASTSAGLRAWRQRQHGATDAACSLAVSAAARQPAGAPLAARA